MNKEESDSANSESIKGDRTDKRREYLAPRTPAEELLTEAFGSVLDVSRIGVFDNLWELNADSDLISKLTLQEIFQVGIPTNQLLLHPTIDSLIKLLSDLWGGREVVEEIAWEFLQIRQMSDDEVKKQLAYELADDTPQ